MDEREDRTWVCTYCWRTLPGEAPEPEPDPYEADVNGNLDPVVMCAECRAESADDV
jgi:hypothetical protein